MGWDEIAVTVTNLLCGAYKVHHCIEREASMQCR